MEAITWYLCYRWCKQFNLAKAALLLLQSVSYVSFHIAPWKSMNLLEKQAWQRSSADVGERFQGLLLKIESWVWTRIRFYLSGLLSKLSWLCLDSRYFHHVIWTQCTIADCSWCCHLCLLSQRRYNRDCWKNRYVFTQSFHYLSESFMLFHCLMFGSVFNENSWQVKFNLDHSVS